MEKNGEEEIFGEIKAKNLQENAHKHVCANVSMDTPHSSLEVHGA